MELVETILYVDDMVRSREFYINLGAEVRLESPRFCQLQFGDTRIALLPREYGEEPALSFSCVDLQASIARVLEQGGELLIEPDPALPDTPGAIQAATVLDPAGNTLILWHRSGEGTLP
jgi:predicted enzyme related to lactoylglutathione lyase